MWRPDLFGRKKLLLAFEYGLIIARLAEEHKVPLTAELIERAEKMLENEARTRSASKMATDIIPNIISVFNLDISKG